MERGAVRDVAALVIPRIGRVVESMDSAVAFRVVDAAGQELPAAVSEFLREMVACDASPTTLRSYSHELLTLQRPERSVKRPPLYDAKSATRPASVDRGHLLVVATRPELNQCKIVPSTPCVSSGARRCLVDYSALPSVNVPVAGGRFRPSGWSGSGRSRARWSRQWAGGSAGMCRTFSWPHWPAR
jgi:hypothetical protein